MRRLLTVLLVTSVVPLLAQQTPKRYVLIEEFTSATCPPCVQASEKLNAMVRVENGLISVRYHMNWPAPGDPFNVANSTDNNARRQYYGVNSIPFAAVMGSWTGHPVSSAFDNAVQQQRGRPVRLLITVSENRQNAPNIQVQISIRNVSAQALDLSGHVLHVAVVNRRVELPNLPQRLPGSNGETVFYDAMMKMLPSANGTQLSGSLAPGQEQQFGPFVYTLGTGELWPAGQDYVIAFVQNVNTKEVIDAGTNLEQKLTPVTVQLTAPTPQFGYIPRGQTVSKTVTFRNTSSAAYTFRLALDQESSVLLTSWGWSAAIVPDSVTLAPGAAQQFTVSVTAPSDAGYARLTLKPELLTRSSTGILELRDTSIAIGLLTENTKYVLYYGIVPWFSAAYLSVARTIPELRGDFAWLPLLPEDMAAYPIQNFQLAVFPLLDYPLKTPGGELDHIFNAIQQAIQADTRLWIVSNAGLFWAFDPNSTYQTSAARTFYMNTLGLQYIRLQQRYSGNTLVSFPITGVNGDSIGDGFTAMANTSTSAGYNLYTDIFSLRPGSPSKASFYYDNTSASLAGIRLELSNGSRLVYTSFGPEAIADATLRQDLWQRVVRWLLGRAQGQPRIALSAYSLQFDSVELNHTKSLTLTLSNVGQAELRVTRIVLTGTDTSAFNVPDADVVPIVLQPAEETTLEVQFRPTRTGDHTALLTLFSNDPLEGEQGSTVILSGVGKRGVGVADEPALRLQLSPVPASDAVRIVLPEIAATALSVRITDALGRNWFAGDFPVAGRELSLPVGSLPAGAYTVTLSSSTHRFWAPLVIIR